MNLPQLSEVLQVRYLEMVPGSFSVKPTKENFVVCSDRCSPRIPSLVEHFQL